MLLGVKMDWPDFLLHNYYPDEHHDSDGSSAATHNQILVENKNTTIIVEFNYVYAGPIELGGCWARHMYM